jgi:outer membrane biosynthesis protein TonB
MLAYYVHVLQEDKKEDQPKKEEKPKEQPKKEDKPKEQPKKEEKKEPQPEPEQQPVPQVWRGCQFVPSVISRRSAVVRAAPENDVASNAIVSMHTLGVSIMAVAWCL